MTLRSTGRRWLLGALAVSAVLVSGCTPPVDPENDHSSDFVHLSVEDGGLGMVAGVQLYAEEEGEVYFRTDPDAPPSLVLTRTTES
ncbi:hypothetical protein ACH4GE_10945 [Streptomyces tendae]|uniref:hypothetical protein n=1 Tax=Streptomyces tendae TaxID=1932 RepID=UPI00379BD7C4